VNETPADLAEEQAMADKVAKLWRCELKKLPKNYHIDFAIMDGGEVKGFIEMRRRHIKSTDYPDTFLSLKKWMGLQAVAKTTGLPVHWCVQYDDKICSIKVADQKLKLGINGNRMRGYEDSFEPVVHIPIADLKEVKERGFVVRLDDERTTQRRMIR